VSERDSNERPTVLVTGASGFVGGYLVESFASRANVVAWARSAPPLTLEPLALWHQIDLLKREDVRVGIRAVEPAVVFHCAGLSHVDHSWRYPSAPLAANVLATHHLLDALRRTGKPARVLVTGSAAVYAPSPAPLGEDSPLAPHGPYATSKLAQEMLGLRAVAEDGIDVIVARAFNHTGPRQTAAFVAPAIARQIALIERGEMRPVITLGNVETERDISDVRDVVRAYGALAERGSPGTIYNVASGVGRSIRSLVETLIAEAGIDVRLEIDPAKLRPVDNLIVVGDATRLKEATGWAPEIPFERTLRDLLQYWRSIEG
jgi:GDP-4-dehydro-6-deoxy-D-mannose reductase